jgi:hypothetical protein
MIYIIIPLIFILMGYHIVKIITGGFFNSFSYFKLSKDIKSGILKRQHKRSYYKNFIYWKIYSRTKYNNRMGKTQTYRCNGP